MSDCRPPEGFAPAAGAQHPSLGITSYVLLAEKASSNLVEQIVSQVAD